MTSASADSNLLTVERSTDERDEEPSPAPDDGPGDLPLDVVFGILKNRRRRLVLHYLVEVSPTTTLSDLAEHIAALENDKPEEELTSSERKRVYVCLYQCHLPKLDDAGVVSFEDNRGTVELVDGVEQFTDYLDLGEDEDERDWPKYYAGLAAVSVAAFLAQRLFYPSQVLSGVIIGVALAVVINLALEHAYRRGVLRPDDAGRDDATDAQPN